MNVGTDGAEAVRETVESASVFEPDKQWPAWDKAVLHGPAGAYVQCLAPHTEADPIGLLIHLLVAFGNAVGRSVHIEAGGTDHYLNLFAVLVGDSSKARKGTAWAPIRKSFGRIDGAWTDSRIQGGLSSGEGLIWAVRDPVERREPVKEKGRFTGDYQVYEADPGITDKRLLILEPEFAGVLKVCEREKNTLSAIIRQAWDDGVLRVMTKNSPARATAAHISAIGHITSEELLRSLDTVEAANGFGNRFVWFAVRRSRFLPFGGNLKETELAPHEQRVKRAVEFARKGGEFTFSPSAARLWEAVYPELSEGRPGLLGAILARAEAQTLRLTCLYAALDCTLIIQPDHLEAAIALWDYAKASAEYIFGSKLGDPDADAIMTALRMNPEGLTQTQISNTVFSRSVPAERLDRAFATLLRHNLVRVEERQTGGRPSRVWILNRRESRQ
jgi:hypothetical protein